MIRIGHSFWAFFVGISQIACTGIRVEYRYFKAIHGSDVISGEPSTRILSVQSLAVCGMVCGADDTCSGYNYFTETGRCELLASPCLPGSETPSAGSVYMERLDKREYSGQ